MWGGVEAGLGGFCTIMVRGSHSRGLGRAGPCWEVQCKSLFVLMMSTTVSIVGVLGICTIVVCGHHSRGLGRAGSCWDAQCKSLLVLLTSNAVCNVGVLGITCMLPLDASSRMERWPLGHRMVKIHRALMYHAHCYWFVPPGGGRDDHLSRRLVAALCGPSPLAVMVTSHLAWSRLSPGILYSAIQGMPIIVVICCPQSFPSTSIWVQKLS